MSASSFGASAASIADTTGKTAASNRTTRRIQSHRSKYARGGASKSPSSPLHTEEALLDPVSVGKLILPAPIDSLRSKITTLMQCISAIPLSSSRRSDRWGRRKGGDDECHPAVVGQFDMRLFVATRGYE